MSCMDAAAAREIARISHGSQLDRAGELVIDHVCRVAGTGPEDARAVALLHDVLERTDVSVEELRSAGLTTVESDALLLMTRLADESFEAHVLRIEHAPGAAGRIARSVKLADIDDHISQGPPPDGAPPYAWGRRHIRIGRERYDEAPDPAPLVPRLAPPISSRAA